MRRFALTGLLAATLMAVAARPAAAHGYLVRAIPEDRATLQRAPARLQYWFSEDLEPEFSTIEVRDRDGTVIARGGVDDRERALMVVRMPADLPDGAYVVALRPAFASDGHVVAESRVFFVGEAAGDARGAAAADLPLALEAVWRGIVLTATVVLFGAFALYAFVLVPAWGSRKHRAGLLPPRVMRRLNRIIALALLAAFGGNALALLQQSMVFFDADAGQVIEQGLWKIVRIGSRFGDVWTARMVLLALVALLHGAGSYLRDEQPEAVRAFWSANLWLGVLILGTFGAASHAAGSLLLPWVGIAVDWLHLLAVGLWAGGLVALVLVLPVALRPYQGDARRRALLAALRRFSRMAAAAVLVVTATGIYNALNWFNRPVELTETTYGGALLLKAALVTALLAVGIAHHAALRPARYARCAALLERVGGMGRSLAVEGLLVVPVLLAAGLLSATPIPIPDIGNRDVAAPKATQTLDAWTVSMMLSPGGPGVNTYDLRIARDGAPVDALDVRLQTANPARDWRGAWQIVENVDAGLYVGAGDEIDRAGRWLTLVDFADGDGVMTRLVFDWSIEARAAVVQSRAPGVLNVLALGGVFAALAGAGYPSGRRVYRQLDLRPASVALAAGAIAATVLAIFGAVAMIERSRARYEASLNPPPAVVNTVLPDAASLARGRALYIEHCLEWQAAAGDFAALRGRLPRTRDDELFAITREGWQSLPPCSGDLSPARRWDIVNFFRTLRG